MFTKDKGESMGTLEVVAGELGSWGRNWAGCGQLCAGAGYEGAGSRKWGSGEWMVM